MTQTDKICALQAFLIAGDYPEAKDIDEIEPCSSENLFEAFGNEYLVLTDSEADNHVGDYIRNSLWAFNAEFVANECDLHDAVDMIRNNQEKCEAGNDAVRALIDGTCGIDSFVEAAVLTDGRGHFLSSYDGNEHEQGEFFIYQTN